MAFVFDARCTPQSCLAADADGVALAPGSGRIGSTRMTVQSVYYSFRPRDTLTRAVTYDGLSGEVPYGVHQTPS